MVTIVRGTMASAFAVAIASRALFDVNHLMADRELTLAIYGVLGTFYSILLAFVISGIWQNYKDAVGSIQDESDALMGLIYTLGAVPTRRFAPWRLPTQRR